jgi:hypothetical protein
MNFVVLVFFIAVALLAGKLMPFDGIDCSVRFLQLLIESTCRTQVCNGPGETPL